MCIFLHMCLNVCIQDVGGITPGPGAYNLRAKRTHKGKANRATDRRQAQATTRNVAWSKTVVRICMCVCV
jgi:hypothetical protein